MLLVTTLSLLICSLVANSAADPQPQQHQQQQLQGRPIYAIQGGPPPQQRQQQPQAQYQHPSYASAPQAPQNYPRPQNIQNNYVANSSPKPISIHQLPNPSPVQPPIARQQLAGPPRQQQQQQQVQQQASANRINSPLGDVQAVYGQQPSFVPSRNRYPPPQQQQSKYSSQLKAPQAQQQGPRQNQLTSEEQAELDEEEEQKPDRLTLLLQESKFTCSGKKDGYYADDGLNCEVFHYCQDGGKHSWMCPNNFAFHQVHLICVPPSSDNICKQSSNYHFVNEYLYRPVNEKEAQATNASLKYADRYYPDGYTPGTPLDEMLSSHDGQSQGQIQYEPRAPQAFKNYRPSIPNSSGNGNGGHGNGNRNVYFSPESVNIPLSQRRPQASRVSPQAAKPNSAQQYEEYEDEEY